MHRIDLNGEWWLKGTSTEGEVFELSAKVPGSTLSAVLESDAEKDFDVFYRDNADKVQKYEGYSWIYTKKFDLKQADKTMLLVFEKLDTYCDIYINDIKTNNTMFLPFNNKNNYIYKTRIFCTISNRL